MVDFPDMSGLLPVLLTHLSNFEHMVHLKNPVCFNFDL